MRLRIDPTLKDTPAREDESMGSILVKHGQFKIAIERRR
jgi:hypothetical protein